MRTRSKNIYREVERLGVDGKAELSLRASVGHHITRDGSDLLLVTLTLKPRTRKGTDVDERLRCDTTTFRHQRQEGMGEGGKFD